MTLAGVFFYLFASVLVASAVMVVTARNPVHAVLFLILAFFNAAGLFILLGAEFLAMTLVIVYVGAVAVLFLFVVMMIDVDFAELRAGFLKLLPVGATVGGILLAELILVLSSWQFSNEGLSTAQLPASDSKLTNTEQIGQVLYTKYVFFFEAAGIILLVAMVGAIILTLKHREGVKRQDIGAQVARKQTIELKQVEPGSGI